MSASDHFPVFIELSCEPQAARKEQTEPQERSDDREQASEILGKQGGRHG